MSDTVSFNLSNGIREAAHPLTGASTDYDPLMRLIDNARFVLLGEASHGTHNIRAPTHVRIEQAENGADMALQIESSDAATTLVCLRSAILPEMVDGIVSE